MKTAITLLLKNIVRDFSDYKILNLFSKRIKANILDILKEVAASQSY